MKTTRRFFVAAPVARRRIALTSTVRHQQGVVLFIALIVLVAMTLAGIGLMRSVDTAVVATGNLAFRQSTLQGADRGIAAAASWLEANKGGPTLQNSNSGSAYFSSRFAADPDWSDSASWAGSVTLAVDASGNVVRYVINRMCTEANTPYNGSNAGVPNQCGLFFPPTAAATGGSLAVGAPNFQGIPQLYYRVTVRVEGPRNTVSIVQASILVQA